MIMMLLLSSDTFACAESASANSSPRTYTQDVILPGMLKHAQGADCLAQVLASYDFLDKLLLCSKLRLRAFEFLRHQEKTAVRLGIRAAFVAQGQQCRIVAPAWLLDWMPCTPSSVCSN